MKTKVILDEAGEYKRIEKTLHGFALNHRLSGNKIGTCFKDDWVYLEDGEALVAYNFIGEYRTEIQEKKLRENIENLG